MLPMEFYRDHLHLSGPLLERAAAVSEVVVLPQGEPLIRQGEVPTSLYFLLHGTLRGFLLDVNGRDITDCIVYRFGEAAMPDNDITQPASITVEALSECELVAIPIPEVLRLLSDFPALSGIYQQLTLRSANMHRGLKIALCQYSATQRYQWFLQEYPGLIHKVSHKYIASLLNMTPVTFSRVRREFREHDNLYG